MKTATRESAARSLETPQQVVDPKDFTLYLYLIDGTVEEVTPVTGLRLTNNEVVCLLGEIVVARLSRRKVYFASPQPCPPPMLF